MNKEPAHLRACILLEENGFDGEKIITLLNAGGFRIVPKYKKYHLEELLEGITEENRHDEIGPGAAPVSNGDRATEAQYTGSNTGGRHARR